MARAGFTAPLPAKLYFRIGEVAKLCALEAYVLRYWETQFPQLRPEKARSGQRVYKRKDLELILRLKALLYEQRFTIAGARRLLAGEERDGTARRDDAAAAAAARDATLARESALRGLAGLRKGVRELRALIDEDAAADPSALHAVERT